MCPCLCKHHGSGVGGGHYTTYRRLPGPAKCGAACQRCSGAGCDQWVHASDEAVQAVSVRQVLSAEAFMLFYERAGSESTSADGPFMPWNHEIELKCP